MSGPHSGRLGCLPLNAGAGNGTVAVSAVHVRHRSVTDCSLCARNKIAQLATIRGSRENCAGEEPAALHCLCLGPQSVYVCSREGSLPGCLHGANLKQFILRL